MTRVLVVEDSPTQAEELRLVLESEGCEVEIARDGKEGLARARGAEFDVVLSDIVMPGLSGYELCRALKGDPERRNLPVVLLTSLHDPMDIIAGLECGADNFLTKPCAPDRLLARLRQILENRELRAEGKLKVGVEVLFLGKRFTINSDKEQILDLLVSTFEDIVRTNRDLEANRAELAQAKKKLEEYARRVEGMYRTTREKHLHLMEHALDGIFVLDGDGRVREANRRAGEMAGRPPAELLGADFESFFLSGTPEDRRLEYRRVWTEGSARAGEIRLARPEGGEAFADLSASLVEIEGEKMAIVIARDVTRRRLLEAQLRQAQKMEAVGQLAGGVAHDFNNLLTAIQGYSDLAIRTLAERDPLREDLGEIQRAAERGAALTRQLLAFSRKQIISPRALDLSAVVSDMEKLLRRVIGEDVELVFSPTPGLGRVRADPAQIEQVIMNLAVNARDAMPAGGRLSMETSDVDLDETYVRGHVGARPGRYVLLAVTDTGCGMDEETKSHIFEPFFTTKGPGKGTGLGLATVYGIVKQNEGAIWVYSEPGRGTTFKIYLPRVDEPAEPVVPRKQTARILAGTETVLVVEDEGAVRTLLVRILKRHGYRVLEASHGGEALLACERYEGTIDLLVTDVVMPGMSGRELAVRVAPLRPGMRVLYLSGYTANAIVQHGVLEPGTAFLEKPFTAEELARKVREVLDRTE